MKRHTSVAAIFILAIGLIAGRADAAEPCPTGLVEGKRITVLVEGDGPDVVLIPGLSSPRAVWDVTTDRLKDKYRLHRVQIRGFGDDAGVNAGGPVLDPLMREVADYVDDCITDQGGAPPAIIGHSMGGHGALTIGLRRSGAAAIIVLGMATFIELILAPVRGESYGTLASANMGIVLAYCGLQLYCYRVNENKTGK